mmetsp:Transcript_15377/g.39646  ORF Transcript_15377/g.39646 Transcript_15377/m.39646 type:complete len:196 (+) Transcript_15377:156-743(+)
MALPVFKLAYIFSKQIAKPIGKRVVAVAHSSPWVSSNLVEPIGQWAHWITIRSERIIAGNWRATVRPVKPEVALEWGASVLSESFVFGVAAGFVIVEYADKDKKEALKKLEIREWRKQMTERTAMLELKIEQIVEKEKEEKAMLQAEIAALQREAHSNITNSAGSVVTNAATAAYRVGSHIAMSMVYWLGRPGAT